MFSKIQTFIQKDIILAIKDLKSISHLNQLYSNFLPWSGASVRPTALMCMLNDILVNDRYVIVECGAGISTIFIASLLKEIGNKEKQVYAIDHDENWLRILESKLKKNELSEYVNLIHAPLSNSSYCLDEHATWYDAEVLDKKVPQENIDFLFIDGPPANKKGIEKSRYSVMNYFADKFSPQHIVIIDDADRRGEADLARDWKVKHGLNFKRRILDGNIFIGKAGESYNIH